MFPALSASQQQDLLLLLAQKQLQNSLGQSNPLAQIVKMNMQLNALKLLSQEAGSTNPDNSQAQLLAALRYAGQGNNTTPQLSQLLASQLSGLVTPNKSGLLSLMDAEGSASSDISRLQSGGPKEKSTGKKESKSGLKQTNIPAFSNQQSLGGPFEGHDNDDKDSDGLNSKSKKIKKMNVCGHPERSHYAKNMCNQCYHKHGRTKKPWKCNHEKLYAHGLCQNCYINAYNKKRNQKGPENGSTGSNSVAHDVENDIPISSISTTEPLIVEDKMAFGNMDEIEPKEKEMAPEVELKTKEPAMDVETAIDVESVTEVKPVADVEPAIEAELKEKELATEAELKEKEPAIEAEQNEKEPAIEAEQNEKEPATEAEQNEKEPAPEAQPEADKATL